MGMDPDLRERAVELLLREAEFLDEKRWDDWLDLYTEDAEFWIPAWDGEHTLTKDPNREISLIYYQSRAGLEDRIFRLRTELSLASTPLPRTVHLLTNHRFNASGDGVIEVRSNYTTHSYKHKTTKTFYGYYEHRLRLSGDRLLIARKRVIVLNDTIPTVLDLYSV